MTDRSQNSKGFTLVEAMIAMVILVIVFMGLIQAALLTIDYNMRNELRDEGSRVASEAMARIRTVPFTDAVLNDKTGEASDNIPHTCGANGEQLSCLGGSLQPTPATGWKDYNPNVTGTPVALQENPNVQKRIRLLTQWYCRCMRVTNIDAQPTIKRVEIAAFWIDPKGETHTHTVSANLRAQ